MKQTLIKVLNIPLHYIGIQLIPEWNFQWRRYARTFCFSGKEFNYFYHSYNCGWPPYVTERSVELALADFWLDHIDPSDVIEIGAVTPYYWPGRVSSIVDPCDSHPAVTLRQSVLYCTCSQIVIL